MPDLYFKTYIKTSKYFQDNNFELIDDETINKKNSLKLFAFLCINNPRFAFGETKRHDAIECEKQFNKFEIYQVIKITDYKIIFYKNN